MTDIYQTVTAKTYACSHTTQVVTDSRVTGRQFENKLPPEHRKKPHPLDITSRAEQNRFSATASVSKRWFTYVGTCSVSAIAHSITGTSYYYDTYPPTITNFSHRDGWIQAIRNKIQDDKVSFADTIGEWREAVGLFGSAIRSTMRAMRTARDLVKKRNRRRTLARWFRGQFGRNPDTPVQLIDAITLDLMIKFGVKPTLNQLWDTLEALGRVSARKRRLQVTVPSDARITIPGVNGGELLLQSKRTSRCVVFVTYDLDSSEFTAGNLAEALWAGTNLSFVLDWFVDVGGYLSSFNAMRGVASLVGFVSHREKVEGTDTRKSTSGVSSALTTPGKVKWERKVRVKLTTLPFADPPTFELPDTDLWGRLHTLIEMLSTMRASRH